MIFALALAAGGPPLADGLPSATTTDVDLADKAWDACLKKFAKNAGELTTDPTDIVVEISFYACDAERSKAEFAYRRLLVTSSRFKPTDDQAKQTAARTYDDHAARKRRDLMVHVSYLRQMQELDRQKRALRITPPSLK